MSGREELPHPPPHRESPTLPREQWHGASGKMHSRAGVMIYPKAGARFVPQKRTTLA